jgi:hypothetical protein
MGKRGSKSFKKKVDRESKHIHDEKICDEFCQLIENQEKSTKPNRRQY